MKNNNIHFGGIEQSLTDKIDFTIYSSIAILVDENTLENCYLKVKNIFPTHFIIEIKSGEINKTLSTCSQIWDEMTKLKMDRNSLLVNLGGGVIGDMGGFCASTFKRGIDFINIPTTLLAMVDASVGGKTGVDFNGFKNHIGLFSEPKKVLINSLFLDSLSIRQKLSGAAEIIKHGLISNLDLETIFNKIKQQNFDIELIKESVKFKESIVESDFKESGERKMLNFGHTIGHGIESYFLEKEGLLHGEAIMIGIICELYLSIQKLRLDQVIAENIIQQINAVFSFRKFTESESKSISKLIIQDKKNTNGEIKCVLLAKIGTAKYDITITLNDVLDSILFYNSTLKK